MSKNEVASNLTHHLNDAHGLLVRLVSAPKPDRLPLSALLRDALALLRDAMIRSGHPSMRILDTVYVMAARLPSISEARYLGALSLMIRTLSGVRQDLQRAGYDVPTAREISKRAMQDRPQWRRNRSDKFIAA